MRAVFIKYLARIWVQVIYLVISEHGDEVRK